MDFKQFVHDERVRINEEIRKLNDQKAGLDRQIADLSIELKAIDAYEKAKSGHAPSSGKRRTGIRQEVLEVVKGKPKGIKRQDILAAMNATEKRAQQSVSNALANLKKAGAISGEGGIYKPA